MYPVICSKITSSAHVVSAAGRSVEAPQRIFSSVRGFHHIFDDEIFYSGYDWFESDIDSTEEADFNAKRYESVGNQVPINLLCDYAYEYGGAEIYLPSGNYGGVWTLRGDVRLRGDGSSSVVDRVVLVGANSGVSKCRVDSRRWS